ncbi:hypothetical protein ABPG74_018342 [Tetrahymena malaccensis]
MSSALFSIQNIFEKGIIVQFASDTQLLTITTENLKIDSLSINVSGNEYQIIVYKLSSLYQQIKKKGYQEILFAINNLYFNNQQCKEDQEITQYEILPYGLQENIEQLRIDQSNIYHEEGELKFDQCYFKSILESKKQMQKILQNETLPNQEYQNSTQNQFEEAFNNLNDLVMNLITKDTNFNTSVDFQFWREFLTEDTIRLSHIQFIDKQRLYHVFEPQEVMNQFIENSNNYSFLISLIEKKNLILSLDYLEIVIECSNIKYHPSESNWWCRTCFDIEKKKIKAKDYFQYRVFDLKNIRVQHLNIHLNQNIPIFHDVIIHHPMNKVRISGPKGFGVNFLFKNNSHINVVEWDVQQYSLPSTLYMLEYYFQGRIGHLHFINQSKQIIIDSFVSSNIFSSYISYSFQNCCEYYQGRISIFKELQILLNSRFIIMLQATYLYRLSHTLNISPFRIFQDLYF